MRNTNNEYGQRDHTKKKKNLKTELSEYTDWTLAFHFTFSTCTVELSEFSQLERLVDLKKRQLVDLTSAHAHTNVFGRICLFHTAKIRTQHYLVKWQVNSRRNWLRAKAERSQGGKTTCIHKKKEEIVPYAAARGLTWDNSRWIFQRLSVAWIIKMPLVQSGEAGYIAGIF